MFTKPVSNETFKRGDIVVPSIIWRKETAPINIHRLPQEAVVVSVSDCGNYLVTRSKGKTWTRRMHVKYWTLKHV